MFPLGKIQVSHASLLLLMGACEPLLRARRSPGEPPWMAITSAIGDLWRGRAGMLIQSDEHATRRPSPLGGEGT